MNDKNLLDYQASSSLPMKKKYFKYNNNSLKEYYKMREYPIECPYCKSLFNIKNIQQHLRGVNCKKQKEYLLKLDPNIEIKFMIELNKIKKKIKYNEEIE